ncbi:DUF3017 domain-containing protein [Streptomyces sp. NPDC127072]|uniref:DUF3017 domain-containing protein n=1 Tax=Streptomyces sp. NPDC127072 TaxID=3347129 RepID=UPI003649FE8F
MTGGTADERTAGERTADGAEGAVRGVPVNGADPVARGVSGNGAGPAVREATREGADDADDAGSEAAEHGGPDSPSEADREGEGEGAGGSESDFTEPVAVDAVSAPDAEGNPRRATRRFPLFTRDTARPEGGGRAAPGDAPAPARQWPILAVLGLVGLGLLLTAFDVFRYGTILIGVALLGGAVLRWTLPDVGMLAVRSRFTDLVTYGVLGVAIVLLALMAQPDPWLEIPFLDDTLHFTVR